jgi:hypothetical protein
MHFSSAERHLVADFECPPIQVNGKMLITQAKSVLNEHILIVLIKLLMANVRFFRLRHFATKTSADENYQKLTNSLN